MKEERKIVLEGQEYTVVISDEQKALSTADAVGRAIIGLWDRNIPEQNLAPAIYIAERLEDIDEEYLEQVVRRKIGLPWIIGETDRLLIREFCMEDIPQVMQEAEDQEADQVFYTPAALQEYIRGQYGFYQYGIWALVEKESGRIIGKAGITNMEMESFADYEVPEEKHMSYLELGYHIFTPYRKQGYAREACAEIQDYVKSHLDCALYAKIDPSNEASIRLAKDCGFRIISQRCNGAIGCYSLYAWNC